MIFVSLRFWVRCKFILFCCCLCFNYTTIITEVNTFRTFCIWQSPSLYHKMRLAKSIYPVAVISTFSFWNRASGPHGKSKLSCCYSNTNKKGSPHLRLRLVTSEYNIAHKGTKKRSPPFPIGSCLGLFSCHQTQTYQI